MLRKRIIFTLIYENNFFNQSRNFRLQKVGNISWLEKNYKFQEIAFSLDELIVLNASKQEKNIELFSKVLNNLLDDVFIPIAAGGGIRTLDDAKCLFDNGADKLVINTILYENRALVKQLVQKYGSQSIVANIDYKKINDINCVFINDGKTELDIEFNKYIDEIESLEVGEIYLNSIDKDGTGFGYDLNILNSIPKNLNAPLILAGGAGNYKHFILALENKKIDAVATANLFNFINDGLKIARINLLKNFNFPNWKSEKIVELENIFKK